MTDDPLPICVAALYRFAPFGDCGRLREGLIAVCAQHGIKGTLLLAPEGVNGTIAGTPAGIDQALAHIRALPGCERLSVKLSRAATMPFYRMKVRIKREIVTMGQPHIDPLTDTGHYVSPQDWNALITQPGAILIDTRNDYEVRLGTFAQAANPGTRSFREFPAWFRANRDALFSGKTAPKVAMFCTGGIRCEKATAFLKSEGVDEVYHLEGGILKYLETAPQETSLWQGECFVFDQRVALGHGLAPGSHVLCGACRMPVSPKAQASPLFEAGISCPACHGERNAEQKAGYAERHRQVALAAARGLDHLGAAPSASAKKGRGPGA
ncbi:MAG: Rhodanese domain protein [Caulobacteraceae bacterium]|nr:Rhodanese domain protein [Caulobacteraceae bacterium]